MAKKKLVADPFFPDNSFDVPDFNFDIEEPKDDRKPVVRVAKAVASGAMMGLKDSSFIKRLAREALPPVYGEIADLTSQGTEGVKKLYNSAAKEIKPSVGELARSLNRLVPGEKKRLKNGLKYLDNWASGDKLKRGINDERAQQEKNISLEVGRVFEDINAAQAERDDQIESENRAERKIRDVIEQHRHKDSLSALNTISAGVQNLANYNSKITMKYQQKTLELQMRSYFMQVDAFKLQKVESEKQLAELKVITKNTALPEFVKLKQSEAWREALRNRFISSMNTGLFGKRANFVRNFFEQIGRSVQDKAVQAAGMFAQGAGMADAAGLAKDMPSSKTDKAEMAGEMGGQEGAQYGALRAGRWVREKLDKSPKAAKMAKDLEYGARNVPQKLTKYANDDTNYWQQSWFTRMFKGVLKAGMGSLSPDMRVQTDHLMNLDPQNSLRSNASWNNQNNKSLNEIIPGYLSRIFRELQVLRTGDTSIGLTSYDYTKNRFLDQGKVAKNVLKQIAGGSGKEANKERVDRIMGAIDKDGELDKDMRTALAEMLTSENFKGTEMSPEFLSNERSFKKNDKTKKHAKVISDLFSRYYGMQNGKLPETNEASDKRAEMSQEMTRLGSDFNDARVVIQELINMGQYEELRAIGLVDEDKRSINKDRLIELYNSDTNFTPKSYGVNGKHVLKNGMQQSMPDRNRLNQPTKSNNNALKLNIPQGQGGQRPNPFVEAMDKLTQSVDKLSGNYDVDAQGNKNKPNSFSDDFKVLADQLVKNTGQSNDLLMVIHKTLEAQIESADERAAESIQSSSRFQEFMARFVSKDDPEGESKFEAFKGGMKDRYSSAKDGAKERLDTIGGSLKNIYNKTFGRAVKIAKPIVAVANAGTKAWWNKAVVPTANTALTVGGAAGRFTRNMVSRIRDIYVEGDPPDQPRLLVKKLKKGQYFDAVTGEPVYRLHQLKNGVKDEDGNIVLEKEEIPKAYFRNARGGIVFVAKEIMGAAWRGVGNFQDFMTNKVVKPLAGGAWSAAKLLGTGVRNLFDQAKDIYVKGDTEPTLLARTMKAGGYFSKSTQKPITRPSQIDGSVIDREGNVVLSEEQLKKGIVDKFGAPITGPFINALKVGAGLVVGGLKFAGKVIGGIHKAMGSVFGGAGDLMGNFMGKLSTALGGGKSYDVLVEIKKLLDSRLPAMSNKKKKKIVDKDGDGVRDGSAEDIEKKRKSQVNEVDGLKGGTVESGRENAVDRAMRLAGEAKDKISGWAGDAMDWLGDGSDDGKENKKDRKKRAKSRLGRMKEAAARRTKMAADAARTAGEKVGASKGFAAGKAAAASAASKVAGSPAGQAAGSAAAGIGSKLAGWGGAAMGGLGTAAGFAGKGLMKAIPVAGAAYGAYQGVNDIADGNYGSAALNLGLAAGSGAFALGGMSGVAALGTGALALGGAALTGIGALIASPVVLGAAAIAGAGYLGYKAYKWFTDPTDTPIIRLRLAQYGFGSDDSDYNGAVLEFEKKCLPYVKYEDGKATLDIPDKDANKLIGIFGVKAQEQEQLTNWLSWVQKRFKPVFLTHLTALKSVSPDTSLTAVNKLDGDLKLKYFEMVKMPEGPYDQVISPFPDQKQLGMGHKATSFVIKTVETSIKKDADQAKNKKKSVVSVEGAAAAGTAVAANATAEEMRERLGVGKDQKDKLDAKAIDDANKSMFSRFLEASWKGAKAAIPGLMVGAQVFSYVSDKVGKFLGFSVDADEAVRFKTYGLNQMDRLKVIAVRAIENYLDRNVKFSADGKATWEGAVDDVLSEFKGDFGISDKRGDQAKLFVRWFNERFTTVYLNYRSWLYQSTGKKDQTDAEKALKPEDRASIALKVAGVDVWNKTSSPWSDYVLGTDVGSVKENVQYLDDQVKETQLQEQKKRGEKVAPKTSGLGGAISDKKPEVKPDSPVAKAAAANDKNEAVSPDAEKEGQKAIFEGDSAAVERGMIGKLNKASGDLKDGKGGDQFVSYHNKASLNGVHPEMLKLFKGMAQEYGELTGKSIQVNSGYRSYEDQEAEYRKDPQKAAPPGNSLHEKGLAIDIPSATANELEKLGLLRKYGITRPVGGEPWHLEPAGIQANRDQAKKSEGDAAGLITGGVGKGGGGWGTNPKAGKYSRNDNYAKELLASGDTADTLAKAEMNGTNPTVNGSRDDETKDLLKQLQGGAAAAMKPTGATGVDKPAGDAVTNKGGSNLPGQSEAYGKNAGTDGKAKGYMAVKDTIADAAKTVGVDEKTMVRKAALESSFNPNAKAGTSSATGLYQFTSGTWKEMMQKYGKKFGIPEGTPATDVKANSLMAAQYMKDNKARLEKVAPGGKVTAGDEYMAHFFGPGGASAMLRADPNQIAAMVLPDAAKSNRETFYDKNGNPRTVAEVRKLLDDKTNGILKKFGIDESQFDKKTGDQAQTEQSNPNIIKASLTNSQPNAQPKDLSIPAPAAKVNPEAERVREQERQRIRASLTMNGNPALNPAQPTSVPVQPQTRMDTPSTGMSATNAILTKQLEVQTTSKDFLEKIAANTDMAELKKLLSTMLEKLDGKQEGQDPAVSGDPNKTTYRSPSNAFSDRSPRPIGMKRLT